MIIAYTGLPGGGKTWMMTRDLFRRIRRGIPVYANYPLLGSRFWTRLEEIYGVRFGTIGLDEAGSFVDARKWESLPPVVVRLWQQSRKLSLDFFYTAQTFSDVDKKLRGITNLVWVCRQILPGIHYAKCYPPKIAEKIEMDPDFGQKHKPIASSFFVPSISWNSDLYDTMAVLGKDLDQDFLDPGELPLVDKTTLRMARERFTKRVMSHKKLRKRFKF